MLRDRSRILDARRAWTDPMRTIVALNREKGAVRQRGGVTILCPWHDERSPSCSVTIGDDGTLRVRCFGCGETGDAIDLFAAVHRLDTRRDLQEVLELMGATRVAAPSERFDCRLPAPPALVKSPEPLDADTFDRVAGTILDLCPLEGSTAGYLGSRGVLEEARRAGWGALPENDSARVVTAVIERFGREAWLRSGLASKDGSRFAWSQHTILIPYRAPGVAGQIVNLQRRTPFTPSEKRTPKYVFPTGRSTTPWPFGSEVIEEAGPDTALVFCEGAIDALTLRRCYRADGLNRIVVALPSASTWRAEWARLATGRLAIVATDADAAGEAVATRMVDDLFEAGAVAVQRATPTSGKDWTEALAS